MCSAQEDDAIRSIVHQLGGDDPDNEALRWDVVQQHLRGRSVKLIRDRYGRSPFLPPARPLLPDGDNLILGAVPK